MSGLIKFIFLLLFPFSLYGAPSCPTELMAHTVYLDGLEIPEGTYRVERVSDKGKTYYNFFSIGRTDIEVLRDLYLRIKPFNPELGIDRAGAARDRQNVLSLIDRLIKCQK